MAEVSFIESFPMTKEHIASILALIGKAEATPGMSPTGIMMMSNLKENMSILFDKIERSHLDFATIHLGNPIGLEEIHWEYAKVPKDGKMSKLQAIGQIINAIQHQYSHHIITIELSEENTREFEVLLKITERGIY